ncbi:MAG TPA: LamG-like jellyroll fold domain-containing protein [Ignavibacteria bacterium]
MKKLLLIAFIILLSMPMTSHGQYYYNRSFNFTGATGDYAATKPGAELSITGSFTVECWVNLVNVASPSFQIVVQKRLGSNSTGYTMFLSSGKVVIRTNNTSRLTGSTVIPNGVWTHIASTYNSSTDVFTVYVNGVADGTITATGAAPAADTDSLRFAAGFNSPFAGMMDEIRVWNIERTAADIVATMRMPLGESTGNYTGLVGAWRANTAIVGTGLDEINGNNASLRGAASFTDLSNRPNSHLAFNTGLLCTGAATGICVSIPNAAVLNPTTAVTLECWLFTNNTDVQVIFGKGSSVTGYPYRIVKTLSNNTFVVALNSGTFMGSSPYGGVFPTNRWNHLAFTYNSTTGAYAYYINGQQTAAGTQSVGPLVANSEALTIGGGPSQVTLNGMVDEVRIANYVKTPQEISQEMFCSIDLNNEPNPSNTNVVYSFEGTLMDLTEGAPRGVFTGPGIRFSDVYHNSLEFPAPLDRWDAGKFANGFRVKYSGLTFGAAPTSIMDSIYMGQVLTISDINLFVAANHTYAGDISVSLRNPANTTTRILYPGNANNVGMHMVTIFDDQADSTIGGTVLAPFSPRVKPVNTLSVFNGQPALGWWKIIITDIYPATDNGILLGWGLQFNNQIITGGSSLVTEVPGKFDLYQNYPNPFNPVTTIKYEIAKTVSVKIVVFDILGREIKTLVNEVKKSGSYSLVFDASEFASGSYYYRLSAGDYVNTKKMIVIK